MWRQKKKETSDDSTAGSEVNIRMKQVKEKKRKKRKGGKEV